jgi:hypothetical protein
MRSGRCGNNFSGIPRQILTNITIDEGDRIATIKYADGTSGYTFRIQSVRPSDDAYAPVVYNLQPDGQGFHTLMYSRDPLQKFVILARADGTCIMYAVE